MSLSTVKNSMRGDTILSNWQVVKEKPNKNWQNKTNIITTITQTNFYQWTRYLLRNYHLNFCACSSMNWEGILIRQKTRINNNHQSNFLSVKLFSTSNTIQKNTIGEGLKPAKSSLIWSEGVIIWENVAMSPPSYYVVCLHRPCSQEAAQFISDSLTKSRLHGGADLIVLQVRLG